MDDYIDMTAFWEPDDDNNPWTGLLILIFIIFMIWIFT